MFKNKKVKRGHCVICISPLGGAKNDRGDPSMRKYIYICTFNFGNLHVNLNERLNKECTIGIYDTDSQLLLRATLTINLLCIECINMKSVRVHLLYVKYTLCMHPVFFPFFSSGLSCDLVYFHLTSCGLDMPVTLSNSAKLTPPPPLLPIHTDP